MKLYADPKRVLAAVTDDWETASAIRNRSDGTASCVARILKQLADDGVIERRTAPICGLKLKTIHYRKGARR